VVRARALGILAGYLADRRWGDPQQYHPVAGFGRVAQQLEHRIWTDDRRAGVAYTTALVGGAAVLGSTLERTTLCSPVARFALTAAATWVVLGGRSLEAEAVAVRHRLDLIDLDPAREQLTHLVGRDTAALDAPDIARATIESVAENTSDAVVAPLVAGALFGVPGLLAYRAANTLDAMVGHRNERYANFGWASARLDDLLNWVPARLGALLAVLSAPAVGGAPRQALAAWRRDAAGHPSPNAGQVEAAFAGALGVRLGGVNEYGGVIEDRPTLGDGSAPLPDDIDRATRLGRLVGHASAALAVAVSSRRRSR
jgi:adenosylcobinamide-phosphate synthase